MQRQPGNQAIHLFTQTDDANMEIGYARMPLPPEPGPSLEDRIEWMLEDIQNDAQAIDRVFQGDEKLTMRVANLIAARRSGKQIAATDIVAALDEWIDSELVWVAKEMVDEQ